MPKSRSDQSAEAGFRLPVSTLNSRLANRDRLKILLGDPSRGTYRDGDLTLPAIAALSRYI
jgi:hypothetical protein